MPVRGRGVRDDILTQYRIHTGLPAWPSGLEIGQDFRGKPDRYRLFGRLRLGPPNRTQRLERCRGRLASIWVGRNPGDDAGVFGRGGNTEDPARFRCDVHRL